MKNTIYDKIEEKIKKTDCHRKIGITDNIFLGFIFTCYVAACCAIVFNPKLSLIIFFATVLILTIVWYAVTFEIVYKHYKNINIPNMIKVKSSSSKRRKKKVEPQKVTDTSRPLKRNDSIKIFRIIKLSFEINRERPQLLEIIRENGITTKEGLEEAIAHYRFKAQSSKHLRLDLISILPLIISILTLTLDSQNIKQVPKAVFIILFIGLIIILYIAVHYLYSIILYPYDKKSFYENMEISLSELQAQNAFERNNEKSTS